jgi:hypothetical protein
MNGEICIHFIEDNLVFKKYSYNVPRVGDEIRVGGDGDERYFKVDIVVWVYDEPLTPYERVNIGISRIENER